MPLALRQLFLNRPLLPAAFCLANFHIVFLPTEKEIQIKMGRLTLKNPFMGFLTWLGTNEENQNSSHPDDLAERPAKILFSQLVRDGDGY